MRSARMGCLLFLIAWAGLFGGCRERLGDCSQQADRLCVRVTLGSIQVPDSLTIHAATGSQLLDQTIDQGVSEAFAARDAYVFELDLSTLPPMVPIDVQVTAQRLHQPVGSGSSHYEPGQTQPLQLVLLGGGPDLGTGPYITKITPPSGPTSGKITLTIAGGNFISGAGLGVKVGGFASPAVSFVSAGQLMAELPPGAFGTTQVVVQNPGGEQSAPFDFKYYYATLSFMNSIGYPDIMGGPVAVTALDWDGDGRHQDLAVLNQGTAKVLLLANTGTAFSPVAVMPAVGTTPSALVAGRFNADTRDDLVVANRGANSVSVLLSTGGGAFTALPAVPVGNQPVALAAADFNKDGKVDLAVANSLDLTVTLLRGNGDGTFPTTFLTQLTTGSGPVALVTADFNQDGNMDVAVASSVAKNLNVYVGNGVGGFSQLPNVDLGHNPKSLTTADLDGDGRPDLIVALSDVKQIYVLWGQTGGYFSASDSLKYTALLTSKFPAAVAVADFNRDDLLDLAVANTMDGKVSIYLGGGSRLFSVFATEFSVGGFGSASGIVSRDFDNDGRPDLSVVSAASDSVSTAYNNSQ